MFNTKFFLKISPVCQDGASGAVGAGRHRHRRVHHHHQHPPRDAGARSGRRHHRHVRSHMRLRPGDHQEGDQDGENEGREEYSDRKCHKNNLELKIRIWDRTFSSTFSHGKY